MSFEKLTIIPLRRTKSKKGPAFERDGDGFSVLFNPNTYTVSKSVTWTDPSAAKPGKHSGSDRSVNAPTLTFGGGGSRQISLELFFDVTDPGVRTGQEIYDVRVETAKLVRLTQIDPLLKHPPPVELTWGGGHLTGEEFPFAGVISALSQRFTLFESDGTPLRATLTVTLTEFLDREADLRKTDPEFTTQRVKRGDSLSSIAAQHYNDPALWRAIADANNLDDPHRLEIGRTLTVPKLG